MKVLVTGGSGFTGRRVVSQLVAARHEVVAAARSDTAAAVVSALGATPLGMDLNDPEGIDDAFRSVDAEALVNLASLGFGHAPAIVAGALESGIVRAVFVSTTAIFTTLAAPSKRMRLDAERAVRDSGLAFTIVRPTMIYGAPGDRNLSRMLALLRRAPVFPLPGGGRRLQQPVHVDDLASAICTAVTSPAAEGSIYDVAGPEPLTFRRLVEEAACALGVSPRLVPVPMVPLMAAMRIYERVAPNPHLKTEQLQRLAEDKAFDIGPVRRDLGFDPRTFADGITAEADLLGFRRAGGNADGT